MPNGEGIARRQLERLGNNELRARGENAHFVLEHRERLACVVESHERERRLRPASCGVAGFAVHVCGVRLAQCGLPECRNHCTSALGAVRVALKLQRPRVSSARRRGIRMGFTFTFRKAHPRFPRQCEIPCVPRSRRV